MTRSFEDGITIRPFAEGDQAMVQAFFDQMGGETRSYFDRQDYNTNLGMAWFTPQRMAHMVPFMAEKEGVMLGYVYIHDLDKKIPWLGICVCENCKGHHLGRRLITFISDYAKSKNCGGILLTTHLGNARAQNLYARMGFEYMGFHRGGEALYLLRFDQE